MKILLYGINFSPELTGIGKYTGEMASWLASNGHQVRVVTAPPYYPEWKVRIGYSRFFWSTETRDGVRVFRCPLWVPLIPSGFKRLLHLASFAISSFPVVIRQIWWRPDVVWVVEPTLFCVPVVLCVAKLSSSISWLHIQDFELDAAFSLGVLKGEKAKRFLLRAERWLMRSFSVVSTISYRMHEKLIDKGIDPAKALIFPNWVDISSINVVRKEDRSKAGGFRDVLGISSGAIVVLYSGNMGGKQGLEILADVAQQMDSASDHPRKNIVFVFCGNGFGRADLIERCSNLGNVHFLDLQPVGLLSDLLGMADIHILPQRADAADLVMPSKLTGMLASGRPVVATAFPDTELDRVISGEKGGSACGIVVPPEQPDALAAALVMLSCNESLRELMGNAGRNYAEKNLSAEMILSKFLSDMKSTVK